MNQEQIEKDAELYNKSIARSIGKKFKSERESQQLSQRELSRLSTASIGTISELEQYMNLPKIETILKIGFALKLSVKDIFSEIVNSKTIKDEKVYKKQEDLSFEENAAKLAKLLLMDMGLKEEAADEIISYAKFKLSDHKNLSKSAYEKLTSRCYK